MALTKYSYTLDIDSTLRIFRCKTEPPMNHLATSAISLTNQGADKLATGEYFEAASAYCRAIKITQSLSGQAVEEEEYDSSSSLDDECPWSFDALPVLSAELPYNEIAIFEHCFVVFPHNNNNNNEDAAAVLSSGKFTTRHCEVFTATLIYNLALTYHYCGLCGNSQERMNDALQLYAKSMNMLRGHDSRNGRALLLAICNNAASLSLVLSDHLMHKEFSKQIQNLLTRPMVDLDASFYLRNIAMWENRIIEQRSGHHHDRISAIHNIPAQ